MNVLPFIPSIICGIFVFFIPILMYLPPTKMEQELWQRLNIRILRHWATKNETEKWAQKGTIQNVVKRSRVNIAWHGFITLTFLFLIIQAQFVDNMFIQYGSQLLLIPSIVYFVGSIIQRQKLVIILIREQKRKTV